jgi:hypothetical protein
MTQLSTMRVTQPSLRIIWDLSGVRKAGHQQARSDMPNKALQATAAVLFVSTAVWSHNAVVAEVSALPAAVPELGR